MGQPLHLLVFFAGQEVLAFLDLYGQLLEPPVKIYHHPDLGKFSRHFLKLVLFADYFGLAEKVIERLVSLFNLF